MAHALLLTDVEVGNSSQGKRNSKSEREDVNSGKYRLFHPSHKQGITPTGAYEKGVQLAACTISARV